MKDTYYVRRGVGNEILSIRMSTPYKMEALRSAADSAILNPGFLYDVCYKDEQIAKFYVKDK